MSEFVNTIDVLGDDVVMDSLIDRSITEFKDDELTTIGPYAFAKSLALTEVYLPNVTDIGYCPFEGCSSLKTIRLPSLTNITGWNPAFSGLTSLETLQLDNLLSVGQQVISYSNSLKKICLPKATYIGNGSFQGNRSLEIADFPSATFISQSNTFRDVWTLVALILRSETMATTDGTHIADSNSLSSKAYIYVPRNLISEYQANSNWSGAGVKFRAIEDITVDGTVLGEFLGISNIITSFNGVSGSNTSTYIGVGRSYTTTLTSNNSDPIRYARITMGGTDVTNDVYNPETNEINIPYVTGDIHIMASSLEYAIILQPLNGNIEGDIPRWKLDVTAGMKLAITYYLTRNRGYLYDARGCGGNYVNGPGTGTETTITYTVPSDGFIVFSDFWNNRNGIVNGTVSNTINDAAYGKYIYVMIVG